MLVEFLRPLKASGSISDGTKIEITTQEVRENGRYSTKFEHDLASEQARCAALQKCLEVLGGKVAIIAKPSRSAPHARKLALTWSDGQSWYVRLDSGMGFIRTVRSSRFDFDQSVAQQVASILGRSLAVELDYRHQGPLLLHVGLGMR